MKPKVTIKDVVRETGFSATTISQILNGKGQRFSKPTQDKVKEVAANIGYVPDFFASNINNDLVRIIAVVVPNIQNPFFSKIIEGIERYADEHDFLTIVLDSTPRNKSQKRYVEHILSRAIDGVIFADSYLSNDDNLKLLNEKGIPFVLMDQAKSSKRSENLIDMNDLTGGKIAAEYLLEHNHYNVGIVGPIKESSQNVQKRINGFKKEFLGHQKTNINFYDSSLDFEGGFWAADKILKSRDTAIFALNDAIAVGIYRYLNSQGLSVPNDLSIVGYDDIEIASYVYPSLSTIRQPAYNLGVQGAQKLIKQLLGEKYYKDESQVRLKLMKRLSVKRL